MRFYTEQHRYYCGIDLHARTMFVCILDQKGRTVVHRKLPAEPAPLLRRGDARGGLLRPRGRGLGSLLALRLLGGGMSDKPANQRAGDEVTRIGGNTRGGCEGDRGRQNQC